MKCLILHWCPCDSSDLSYNKHRIPWLKKELTLKNIETEVPLMPSPWEPDYDKFKTEFEKYDIDEDTVLVWHSCSCAFLVRRLWETKTKISKLILVAPWKINDEWWEIRERFYNYKIDNSIKDRVKKIIMFTSDNEEKNGKISLKLFHDTIGWEIIELKSRWHYILSHMKTESFPELLEVILK